MQTQASIASVLACLFRDLANALDWAGVMTLTGICSWASSQATSKSSGAAGGFHLQLDRWCLRRAARSWPSFERVGEVSIEEPRRRGTEELVDPAHRHRCRRGTVEVLLHGHPCKCRAHGNVPKRLRQQFRQARRSEAGHRRDGGVMPRSCRSRSAPRPPAPASTPLRRRVKGYKPGVWTNTKSRRDQRTTKTEPRRCVTGSDGTDDSGRWMKLGLGRGGAGP